MTFMLSLANLTSHICEKAPVPEQSDLTLLFRVEKRARARPTLHVCSHLASTPLRGPEALPMPPPAQTDPYR